jgi:hypothetical protein
LIVTAPTCAVWLFNSCHAAQRMPRNSARSVQRFVRLVVMNVPSTKRIIVNSAPKLVLHAHKSAGTWPRRRRSRLVEDSRYLEQIEPARRRRRQYGCTNSESLCGRCDPPNCSASLPSFVDISLFSRQAFHRIGSFDGDMMLFLGAWLSSYFIVATNA